jgi:hypothetical protein
VQYSVIVDGGSKASRADNLSPLHFSNEDELNHIHRKNVSVYCRILFLFHLFVACWVL